MAQDVKEYQRRYQKERFAKIKADPVAYAALLARQNELNAKNREHVNARARKWYSDNREKILARLKEKKAKDWVKEYRKRPHVMEQRRDSAREYVKNRRRSSPEYRLLVACRKRVGTAVNGVCFSLHTKELIGCDLTTLRNHIESQWKEGMNWQNYGLKGWHIDHVKPCSAFDFTKESEIRECFNYKNLQPLWALENISKGGANRIK